ncbi:hypothetical protein [uncultured Hymenobacter sp.]|uniref:hypothetical protein n=1 Tax=uncultured Hymenobacter sp. TaxID=170016 RepID=UPI0035CCA8E9
MAVAPDYFAQKTPAELQFFVDNPAFYEPALLEEARRELRRRGLAPLPPASAATPAAPPESETEAPVGRARWWALLAAGALLAGGWAWQQQRAAAPATTPAAATQTRKKAPPRLETVETNALPDFSAATAASIERQLAQVPARERARLAAQPRRQYRELSRRFWAAETMTEYLTDRARQGQPNPLLAEQAELVREAWQQWNKAAVYSYEFGPTMTAHLDHMGRVASHQQHILNELPGLVTANKLLTDPEITKRNEEVQDLLSALLPASPVSGKPYRQLRRHIEVKL